jgi:hypothetical protein
MNTRLQADIAEQSDETGLVQDDPKLLQALAALRAQNERLVSVLGCVVESVESDAKERGLTLNPSVAADLMLANELLDEVEQNNLF